MPAWVEMSKSNRPSKAERAVACVRDLKREPTPLAVGLRLVANMQRKSKWSGDESRLFKA